jgi:hypothetical protein
MVSREKLKPIQDQEALVIKTPKKPNRRAPRLLAHPLRLTPFNLLLYQISITARSPHELSLSRAAGSKTPLMRSYSLVLTVRASKEGSLYP